MKRVLVGPGPDDCWLWQGKTIRHADYGYVRYDRKTRLAHRVSYELHYGVRPPADLLVCHRCDTPRCVNPAHLFLGTYSDNVQDMLAKGRSNNAVGERSPSAKLTEDQVRTIRQRLAAGETERALGDEYGVGHTSIHRIKTREHWSHVE